MSATLTEPTNHIREAAAGLNAALGAKDALAPPAPEQVEVRLWKIRKQGGVFEIIDHGIAILDRVAAPVPARGKFSKSPEITGQLWLAYARGEVDLADDDAMKAALAFCKEGNLQPTAVGFVNRGTAIRMCVRAGAKATVSQLDSVGRSIL